MESTVSKLVQDMVPKTVSSKPLSAKVLFFLLFSSVCVRFSLRPAAGHFMHKSSSNLSPNYTVGPTEDIIKILTMLLFKK